MIWYLLQTVAGLLMATAHPIRWGNFVWEPSFLNFILASVGLALFIKVSSLRRRSSHRFLLGLWGGFVFFASSMFWVVHALHIYGEIPLVLAILTACLLWAYCASFLGAWSLLAGFHQVLHRGIVARVILWASLWAALGALRENLFTGFGWGEIGYFFASWPWLGQSASLWGVHGLSFFWVVFVCLVVHFDEWFPVKRLRFQILTASIVWAALVLVSPFIFMGDANERESFRVALIQPNVDQATKWSSVVAKDHLNQLMSLTGESLAENPELVIWPETSYPFALSTNQKQLPISSPVPLLLGAVVADRRLITNSALLVEEDQILHRYQKVHLVPFGEYVPFEKWMPFEKLVANVGRFLPGERNQALMPLSQFMGGLLICYEDIFARHFVRHARAGAELIVNLTNDAWYGQSSAIRQHENIARVHAWSARLPMVRATNNGQTAILFGSHRDVIPPFESGILVGDLSIQKNPSLSFFAWTFPMMEWIWALVFAIGFLWRTRAKNKKIFFPESVN
jgi:apolipoprotein N-acyltransferase